MLFKLYLTETSYSAVFEVYIRQFNMPKFTTKAIRYVTLNKKTANVEINFFLTFLPFNGCISSQYMLNHFIPSMPP